MVHCIVHPPRSQSRSAAGCSLQQNLQGLFEVSNSSEEEFGQDRLLDTVRKHVQLPTTRLLDTILEEVRNFGDADEFEDDVCLLAMEAHRIGTVC